MENSSQQNNQLVQQSTLPQLSQRLINSLGLMLNEEKKSEGKMELLSVTRDLMPGGKPLFKDVIKYPMIRMLAAQVGENVILKNIFLLVKDFCSAVNVVRNMNEDQMIDAAAMLLDECEDFRMEDYVMMFSMAKKGELVDLRDRVDLQIISKIMDEYYIVRRREGELIQEEGIRHYETMGTQTRSIEYLHPSDAKISEAADKLLASYEGVREVLKQGLDSKPLPEQKRELTGEDLRNTPEFKEKMAELEKKYPKT